MADRTALNIRVEMKSEAHACPMGGVPTWEMARAEIELAAQGWWRAAFGDSRHRNSTTANHCS